VTQLDRGAAEDFVDLLGAGAPPKAPPAPAPEPFISAWMEGGKCNKFLQLYNPSDEVVDLSGYATPMMGGKGARGGGMRGGGMRGGGYSRSYSAAPRMRTQTRMYASPMVMPMPMMSPFGMGMGYGYGGISPGAVVGLTVLDAIADEQRRQAYLRSQLETQRQLGKDQASIDQLTAMIDAQDKRIAELQAQVQGAQK